MINRIFEHKTVLFSGLPFRNQENANKLTKNREKLDRSIKILTNLSKTKFFNKKVQKVCQLSETQYTQKVVKNFTTYGLQKKLPISLNFSHRSFMYRCAHVLFRPFTLQFSVFRFSITSLSQNFAFHFLPLLFRILMYVICDEVCCCFCFSMPSMLVCWFVVWSYSFLGCDLVDSLLMAGFSLTSSTLLIC